MRKLHPTILATFIFLWSGLMYAHPHSETGSNRQPIRNVSSHNTVNIIEEGTYRYITSNGIPNHSTGQFPNQNNPNSISAQNHRFRVPLNPQTTGRFTPQEGLIGVALNGVPFEPGTAEAYGKPRGQLGPPTEYKWREEAIVENEGKLGLDKNNAHVQPTGMYHYHGIPYGLLDKLSRDDIVQIGYAADGFKIMVSRSERYTPSYRLRKGNRPDGPGGTYDGTYTADYKYDPSVGNLDPCNGTRLNGEYVYFATKGFPFLPRLLAGKADESFRKNRQEGPSTDRGPRDRQRKGF